MKPPPFAYAAPATLEEAVGLLTARGDPVWLAGEVTRGPQPRGSVRLTGSHPG